VVCFKPAREAIYLHSPAPRQRPTPLPRGAQPLPCQPQLGSAKDWDVIGLVNVTAAMASTWSISGGAGFAAQVYLATTAMRMVSEDGEDAFGPCFFKAAAPVNGRYIRLTITPNGAPVNSIGCLVIGRSWKPAMPREPGTGRPPQDTGSATRLEGGGLATVTGSLLSGFKWIFGDLDPADLKRLWGIFRRRRTTEPLLLVEAPDEPYAEGFHYGRLVDLEAYERRDQSKSRLQMTFEDWV
jgi:hypothetical protein